MKKDFESLKLRMAGLCARSEQCSGDIRTKLLKAGLPRDRAEELIGFLRRERFLDDARYARAFARDKARLGCWGPRKIRLHLGAKGVDGATASAAIAEVDAEDFVEGARKTAEAKARSLDLTAREDIAKLYRHLLSRGFDSDLTARTIKELRAKEARKCQDSED